MAKLHVFSCLFHCRNVTTKVLTYHCLLRLRTGKVFRIRQKLDSMVDVHTLNNEALFNDLAFAATLDLISWKAKSRS